jgi:MoxR-like ATPase
MGNDACLKKECPVNNYCDALAGLGIVLQQAGGQCSASNVLSELSLRQDLAGDLAKKISSVLDLHKSDAEELPLINRIADVYRAEFEARLELWRQMILAPKNGRTFTDVEYAYHSARIDAAKIRAAEAEKEGNQLQIVRARAIFDHFTLREYGLLFNAPMIQVVERLAANLTDGRPALLSGEKGIAKTRAARFVAGLSGEPLIISGHGDMMSDVFTGKIEQDPQTGIFRHTLGKFVEAADSGRPVVLDEVNISDQTIVMRLQDYLLKRPGDIITVQESGHRSYSVKPGFVVFATANEVSPRYQGRNVLDPAFRDRFDVIKFEYPDVGSDANPLTAIPESLLRLALAHAVDERGAVSEHIDLAELETFARLAYVTEYLYSVPAKNVDPNVFKFTVRAVANNANNAAGAFLDDQPPMTDCITPRTLAEIVKHCAEGNKTMTIRDEMRRAINALDQAAGSSANQELANRALMLLERKAGAVV